MSVAELVRDIDARRLSITVEGDDLRLRGDTDRMDADLVGRIRAAKPELIAYLRRREGVRLTPLQRGYLFGRGDLVEMGGVASHVYHEIEGSWDIDRLESALRRVVRRHSALRASFLPDGRQIVHDDVPVHIRTRDLRGLPAHMQRDCLDAYRDRWSHRVMPVDRPPLVVAEVHVLADDRMVLHVSHDGLVMDGISMFLFFRAWWRAYNGEPEGPEELPFADYVEALDRAAGTGPALRSRRYWLDRAEQLAPVPDLPLAANPASIGSPRFTQRLVRLDAATWGELKARAGGYGITPNALLLSAYAQTLAYWGAGESFTVNTTFANRPPIHPRVFDAIGNFSDVLLVEVGIEPGATFEQRARAIQARLRECIENRHYSGVELLAELGRRGATGRARAPYTFNCATGYVHADVDGSALELFGRETFSVSQTPQVWLNAFAMEQHGGLVVQLDGVDALFPEGLLDALAAGYSTLLHRLADADGWTASAFDLRPPDQRRRRELANDTAVAGPGRPLARQFLDRALARPDAPAIITSGGTVTYRDLHRAASHAAAWLRGRGVERDELVGLVMTRGPEQIVGIMATVLAGAAYLPVDATLPERRRGYMLRDGQVRCVLTNLTRGDAAPDGIEVLRLAGTGAGAGQPPVDIEPAGGASLDDLLYVLYTSGTTGEPKGVMVSQRSVANVVADCNARFGVDATDRFFGISAFNFDLSVYDVFGALSAGAAIVLPDHDRAADPEHWLDLCASAGVSVWNSVPAIVALLREQAAARPESLAALRLVMMSGDRIPPGLPAALLRLRPDLEVISLGGPTETTIWNILYPVRSGDDGSRSLPYGRPNSGNRAYVLDASGLDTPDWVTGEICAAGVGLARGYRGDPARTESRFWTDASRGERLYRTGDLGRYLPDGNIEILGRSDFQIKVNGYRIEAGEVETRLVRLDAVKQAAVVRQAAAHGDRLVAHLAAAGDARPGIEQIRAQLRVDLPDYMIPSAVVWHDALPLTRNGKLDRSRLAAAEVADRAPGSTASAVLPVPTGSGATPGPDPDGGAGDGGAGAGPVNGGPIDELAALWAGILRVPRVAADDSFYDLGGDSLAAARVLTEVRKRFRVTIPLDQIYDVRTVRAMAARVAAATQGSTR